MVEIDGGRQAYVLSYNTDEVKGTTASLVATNPLTGDVSERNNFVNDGHVVVTFPADYKGTADCVVTGVDGGEDTGTISVPPSAPAEEAEEPSEEPVEEEPVE